VNVGSRDEVDDEFGLAHFIEHTIFKGTSGLRANSIINRMESIGGELNAYTTKEETAIYSIFPSGGLKRAVSLIGDIVVNSIFPEQELDRERDVVLDELESYLDSPSDAVFDDYDELFFSGNRLAHNILGTYKTVKSFDTETCRSFLHRYYTASNMIFFYMGSEKPQHIGKLLEKSFSGIPQDKAPLLREKPVSPETFSITRSLSNHQSHTVVGAMTGGLYASERYPLALLTNILGGPGMNSRLNVALRERRGLVYMVDATNTVYTDCGLFTVYFGCDHEDVSRCLKLVRAELMRMADTRLSERQLDAYKRQYIGQMTVSRENNEQCALSMARAFLYHHNVLSFKRVADKIREISAEQIRNMAASIISDGLCTLTLG